MQRASAREHCHEIACNVSETACTAALHANNDTLHAYNAALHANSGALPAFNVPVRRLRSLKP